MNKPLAVLVGLSVFAGAWAVPPAALRSVPGEEVCAAARLLLADAAARRGLVAETECPRARAVETVAGALAWAVDARQLVWVAGPARVTLQLTVDGRTRDDVALPVMLNLRSKAWVARRDLHAGDAVEPPDLALRDVSWPVGVVPEAATEPAPHGRLRGALKAGEVVQAGRLLPDTRRLQGDAVKVSLQGAGLRLEMPAVLMADAEIGRRVRVRLDGRPGTLDGLLVDASTVIVER